MISCCSQIRPSALTYGPPALTRCAAFPKESKQRAGSRPDEAVPYALKNMENSRPPDLRATLSFSGCIAAAI